MFAVGSRVGLSGPLEGVVSQVCIRGGGYVQYLVVWWDGTSRHSAWVEPGELRPLSGSAVSRIGFVSVLPG